MLNLFLDTEFTDFESLSLISIGMVSDKGDSFYLESNDYKVEDCSQFVLDIVIPKLEGGAKQTSELIIKQELSIWLTELVKIHSHLNIHYDYQGDLIILDRLLGGSPLINNLTCIKHDFRHAESGVNTIDHISAAHHALLDAQALLERWKKA